MKTGIALSAALASVALAGVWSIPARADKADDTVRYSAYSVTRSMDVYFDPRPNVETLSEAVWDTLVTQDLKTGQIAPLLAKSWTRVNPTTLEFDLRDDVKWHDGETFNADDVTYTLGWLIDDNTRILNKPNWDWIEKVQKINDYKVRVVAKRPTPFDLMRLAYATPIYPEHIFKPMADKALFGTKPIGTGPYKAVHVDINKGILIEKNPAYKWGGAVKPQNNFQRFEVKGLLDDSAHVARFLTGEASLVQVVSVDLYNDLRAQRPKDRHFVVQTGGWQMMAIPSSADKLNPALADARVRRAVMMAVDRSAVEKLRSDQAIAWKTLCDLNEQGCGSDVGAPAYDPAGAKKLLAEAGLPNGFSLVLSASSASGTRKAAEAVASYLHAVGIKAELDLGTAPQLAQKTLEGKIQVMVTGNNSGMMPDASVNVLKWFAGQLYDDPKIDELARRSNLEMDDAKRRKITAELMDYVSKDGRMAPVQVLTRFYLYSPELVMDEAKTSFYPEGWAFRQINWK